MRLDIGVIDWSCIVVLLLTALPTYSSNISRCTGAYCMCRANHFQDSIK